MDLETRRQILHFMGISAAVLLFFFGRNITLIVLGALISFFLILLALRKPLEKTIIGKFIKLFERKDEALKGSVYFYTSCLILAMFFPEWIAAAGITVLAIADSLSTYFGYNYGRNKIFFNKNKSIQGSLAFFISCFAILALFISLLPAGIIAVVVTLVEALPKIDDNISVPIMTALLLIFI